jgi:hypothetical protein
MIRLIFSDAQNPKVLDDRSFLLWKISIALIIVVLEKPRVLADAGFKPLEGRDAFVQVVYINMTI